RWMFSSDTLRSPRSMDPTYVRCRPALAASSSWERSLPSRSSRTREPNARKSAERWRASRGRIARQSRALNTMRLQTLSSVRTDMTEPEEDVPLMTTHDLARVLGFTPKTIVRWYEQGELPGYKIGVRLRFSRTEIGAWIRDRQGPCAEPGADGLQP